jgi:hypothetical protein
MPLLKALLSESSRPGGRSLKPVSFSFSCTLVRSRAAPCPAPERPAPDRESPRRRSGRECSRADTVLPSRTGAQMQGLDEPVLIELAGPVGVGLGGSRLVRQTEDETGDAVELGNPAGFGRWRFGTVGTGRRGWRLAPSTPDGGFGDSLRSAPDGDFGDSVPSTPDGGFGDSLRSAPDGDFGDSVPSTPDGGCSPCTTNER